MSEPLNADFRGGPPKLFDAVGREQLIVLLEHGLVPESRVLDVGCGPLRAGRWLIPLVDPGNYCGIEPMKHLVEAGLSEHFTPDLLSEKMPRFDHNDRFDLSVFGERFTHVLARSIWTHASKRQIEAMLDGFTQVAGEDASFLTSFLPARSRGEDYLGDDWVGRSHRSEEPGVVRHRFSWIRSASEERGLIAQVVDRPVIYNEQVWLAIRPSDARPPVVRGVTNHRAVRRILRRARRS